MTKDSNMPAPTLDPEPTPNAIQLTDEMKVAVKRRMGVPADENLDPWLEAAIGDVLAIVERDRAAEVEREWDALQPCPSIDPDHPVWQCEREAGHEGEHRAMRWQLTWTSEQPTEIPICRGAGTARPQSAPGGDA